MKLKTPRLTESKDSQINILHESILLYSTDNNNDISIWLFCFSIYMCVNMEIHGNMM